MNKTIPGLIVGLALGSGVTWLLVHHSAEKEKSAAPAETAAKPEEKNPLRLPAAKRQQAGITLAKPTATTLAPEVQGYGRVLDASTFATAIGEIETARAALTASEKELERAKKLFAAGGNASAASVETAESTAARDRAALASAQAKFAATWGRNLAAHAGEISTALGDGAALARIDLPPGETPAADPNETHLIIPGRNGDVTAEIIGAAPAADPQIQGIGFLALIRTGAPAPGTTFRAMLPGMGDTVTAFVVPRAAIVYHQGSAWVFALGEEDTFEQKLVTLGRSVGADGIAVVSGLEADDQVAISGAQQLLSAKLQAGDASAEP